MRGSHTRDDLDHVMLEHKSTWLREKAIKVILSPAFDYTMGAVILLNVAVMIVETDSTVNEDETGPEWTVTFGWIVLVIFVLELVLRMFAMRSIFWHDRWNIGDFLIVTIDAVFSVIGLVVGDVFPISILRIFRLAKLARISKLFRVFPELRVLMAGLTGSARAIFWGMVLLLFILLVWSMVAVLFIHPLAKNLDFDGCARCPQAYDSVARAMLTFWQQVVAGDSWGAATMPVIEAHPSTVLFFIPMFMMVGMAVMNLILGVVVEVALSAKSQIEEEDWTEKKIERMETQTHLMNLCESMGVDQEGEVTHDEAFSKFTSPGEFRESILSLDVTEEDFSIIWTVVDADKKGKVPYRDLISKLYTVRSSDSQFMLSYIKFYITQIRNDLLETMRILERKLVTEIQEVEHEVQHLDESTQGKKSSNGQNLAVEEQLYEANPEAWQVLEEAVQKIPTLGDQPAGATESSQELSLDKKTVNSSCGPLDMADFQNTMPVQANVQNSLIAQSANVAEATYEWNDQLCHDIEGLQLELKQTLMALTQSLKSQVSLLSTMNLKMSMKASTRSTV